MRYPRRGFWPLGLALTFTAACTLNKSGLGPDGGGPLPLTDGTAGQGGQGSGGSSGSGGNSGTGGDTGSGGAGEDAASGGSGGTAGVGGSGGAPTGEGGTGGGGTGGLNPTGGSGGAVVDAHPPEVVVVSAAGCADGTREGFLSLNRYPAIAACAGAWSEPGLVSPASYIPLCNRKGGNTGDSILDGTGCSAADLCASGWHVCETAKEVDDLAGNCSDAVAPANTRLVFYAVRQKSYITSCDDTGTNNVHGCGNIGMGPLDECDPLNSQIKAEHCGDYPPWKCGDPSTPTYPSELREVTKTGPDRGGVLCCGN